MAQIVTITNPLTGQPAQVDQLDHTAQQIDDAIARALPGGNIDTTLSLKAPLASPALTGTPTINGVAVAPVHTIPRSSSGFNPNLLDNWYFANPVNQRGQTTYTSSENQYSIDRWIKESGTLTVADGCISTDMTDWHGILQIIEPDLFKALAGKTLTVSILYKNGQLQKVTFTPDPNYTNTDLWMALDSGFGTVIYRWSDGRPNLIYSNSQNGELVAVKLELGDQQTLAHQDADGNWVLNEIPNYGEQLARCQRYFQTFATESLRPTNALDFRPVMRATPALSTITVGGKTLYTANADL